MRYSAISAFMGTLGVVWIGALGFVACTPVGRSGATAGDAADAGELVGAPEPTHEPTALPLAPASEDAAAPRTPGAHRADAGPAARVPVCAPSQTGAWAYFLVGQFAPEDPWAGAARA